MASPLAVLATLLAFVAAVSAVQASSDLRLLQHRANVKAKASHTDAEAIDARHKLDLAAVADNVPITEKGYQQVAERKSDAEMKEFIHRLLAKEARYVKDAAGLEGLVGYYSGTQGVQNLETLKAELRNAPWVAIGEGRTAPLNELGYQKVAKLKSNSHMTAFIRRLLDTKGKKVMDPGALSGVVPYYSGEVATQTFDQLSQEVLNATWVATRDQDPSTVSLAASPVAARRDEDEDLKVASSPAATAHDEDEDLKVAFEGFDLDGNGRLSTAELAKALKTFDGEFSDEVVEEMLTEADSDGNGEIDLKEFKAKTKA